jgi:hypothetical protein
VQRAPRLPSLGFLLAKASQRWNELLSDGFAAHGFGQVRASYGSVLLPLWDEDGLRMGTLAARARNPRGAGTAQQANHDHAGPSRRARRAGRA